jgi:radical SAM protein with 4Fe4S-binding SPASM domain
MIKPYFIFEITPNCNLNCIYCYNIWKQETDYQQKELPINEIKKLFDKILQETEIDGITITGGEPLLYKDLFEVLIFLKEKNIKLGLTTNGIYLTKEVAKRLIDCGVSYFEISLDSLNPEIYTSLTNDNQLNKVKEAILNIKQNNATLAISTIITKLNIESISDIIDLSFAFSADYISLNRFIPTGKGKENITKLLPDIADLKKVLEIANQKAEQYNFQINISVPVEDCIIFHKNYPKLNFGTCLCGVKKWTIDSIGNLRTCEQNPEIIGNLFDSNYAELSKKTNVRKFITNTYTSTCETCKKFYECGGGCRFINN